ncbi:hypothetical protein DICPUDRAFT_52171 [Dictyostelium purpureum]|uniref:Membrane bound O-acyl transferase family protein n=1 Tax=Dictyostelium purpureum TaxID=5786 RepID=F0Z7B5_DICPU|nr:uncharacterized protein DICPUDRAFT_52171 [Dictyostelium purpureum]EGC40111.1 hypothetical protein DICPUDRAFT_52171 [Dictyostelium purpureum]|eukprot:XP_003283301.1 hypothetical protein DICPUDRAFT_52171 [Dictyostelium purpureum]
MSDLDAYLGSFGFPADQIKTVICLLASYPFAYLLRKLPNANLKHMLNIFLGIAYCTWSLGQWSWVHSFISSLISYGLLMVLPRRYSQLVVFAFCLGYLSVSHIYRIWTDYMGWTLDFTGPQMILTLKLTSFAWNLSDGSKPDNELSSDQKRRSIKKLPNLLEFFGFVYFFPTFLAGPTIEITDYLDYTSGKMFKDEKLKGKIPNSFLPSMKTLGYGLFVFPFVILSGYFPVLDLADPSFGFEPLYLRIIKIHIHVALTRFRYYFGWYMSEGSAVLSGIGFNGYTKEGKIRWDRITNVYPLTVEFASNIRDISNCWNIGTSDWLKRYVYLRLTPPGSKPTFFATLATYAVSAFWHGFYPGYYIFFAASTFLTEVAKDMRRKIRPYFVKGADEKPIQPQKKIYDILGTCLCEWFLSFFGASFLFLNSERSIQLWRSFSYAPIILLLSTFVLLRFVIPTPRSNKPKVIEKKQN